MRPSDRTNDEYWMKRAIQLAKRGIGFTHPNPPVGAVIVKNGKLVGQGYHKRAGGPHAEIVALDNAGGKARHATLYVTLEPCSTQGRTGPCTEAIIQSGIRRVVMAMIDPNPRHAGRAVGILKRAGIKVSLGTCADAARRLIAPFAKWVTRGLPYVTVKLGMSVDGKIADFHGRSRWITSAASRRVADELRREADSVMVGARTAFLDNPSLLYRKAPKRHPAYRVVVDSRGRLPLRAKVLNDRHADRTIIAVTRLCAKSRQRRYAAKGCAVWQLPDNRGHVSLSALLRRLGRAGVLHVLCEGGGELAYSLTLSKLVDEYVFSVAPCIIGGKRSASAVGGTGWSLNRCPQLTFVECSRVGDDFLLRAVPKDVGVQRKCLQA